MTDDFEDEQGSDILDFSEDEDTKEGIEGFGDEVVGCTVESLEIWPDPAAERILMGAINHELLNDLIDVNPEFQRGLVWGKERQGELIVSILRNQYIAPVILSRVINANGREIRRCIDGKQRLSSVLMFMAGELPFRHPKTRASYWWTVDSDKRSKRKLVPLCWRKEFLKRALTVVEYQGLSEYQERELFERVQLGSELTVPERQQAKLTPRSTWINALKTTYLGESSSLYDRLDTARAADFRVIANLIYCLDNIAAHPTPTKQKVGAWLDSPNGASDSLKARVDNVLCTMSRFAGDDDLCYGFGKIFTARHVAPVEFIFIGILIDKMSSRCNDQTIADAVLGIRIQTRVKNRDVRTNSTICNFLWNEVEKILACEIAPARKSSAAKKKSKKKRIEPAGVNADTGVQSASGAMVLGHSQVGAVGNDDVQHHSPPRRATAHAENTAEERVEDSTLRTPATFAPNASRRSVPQATVADVEETNRGTRALSVYVSTVSRREQSLPVHNDANGPPYEEDQATTNVVRQTASKKRQIVEVVLRTPKRRLSMVGVGVFEEGRVADDDEQLPIPSAKRPKQASASAPSTSLRGAGRTEVNANARSRRVRRPSLRKLGAET